MRSGAGVGFERATAWKFLRRPAERVSARGEYQLVIEQLQPKGIGEREMAFRKIKEKL